MSRYSGNLVSIEYDISLDTSELDQRLDEITERLDGIERLDEDKVSELIDSALGDTQDFVRTDDFDPDDITSRLDDIEEASRRIETSVEGIDVDDLRDRLAELEGNLPQNPEALRVLEERLDTATRQVEELTTRVTELISADRQAQTVFNLLREAILLAVRR